MKLEDMEIVYKNREGNHDILFNLFLKLSSYDNRGHDLIHRLDLPTCKKI